MLTRTQFFPSPIRFRQSQRRLRSWTQERCPSKPSSEQLTIHSNRAQRLPTPRRLRLPRQNRKTLRGAPITFRKAPQPASHLPRQAAHFLHRHTPQQHQHTPPPPLPSYHPSRSQTGLLLHPTHRQRPPDAPPPRRNRRPRGPQRGRRVDRRTLRLWQPGRQHRRSDGADEWRQVRRNVPPGQKFGEREV